MFSREMLKTEAKKVLKGSYLMSLFASIIPSVIMSVISYIIVNPIITSILGSVSLSTLYYGNSDEQFRSAMVILTTTMSITLIISMLVGFLLAPLSVGIVKYYIQASKGDVDIKHVFSTFTDGHLGNYYKVMILSSLRIMGYTLLFVIPGIIESYKQFFVTYVLAENPDMSTSDVLKESKRLSEGIKGDIFVLQLSFIGWALLVSIANTLLSNPIIDFNIFLTPYISMTSAILYRHMLFARSTQVPGYSDVNYAANVGQGFNPALQGMNITPQNPTMQQSFPSNPAQQNPNMQQSFPNNSIPAATNEQQSFPNVQANQNFVPETIPEPERAPFTTPDAPTYTKEQYLNQNAPINANNNEPQIPQQQNVSFTGNNPPQQVNEPVSSNEDLGNAVVQEAPEKTSFFEKEPEVSLPPEPEKPVFTEPEIKPDENPFTTIEKPKNPYGIGSMSSGENSPPEFPTFESYEKKKEEERKAKEEETKNTDDFNNF